MAFLLNSFVVAVLGSIAYGKKGREMIGQWMAKQKQQQQINQAKLQKEKSKAELDKERALYARMAEARKRQT